MLAAQAGGADRVELCAALVEGGITPSRATILEAAQLDIDTMVMIRPRGGDFVYSPGELRVMESDIAFCREQGVAGVVFGVLQADGHVDFDVVARLVNAAGPLAVTFHRAFDVCRDPVGTMFRLAELGVSRILTSGQEPTVPEGLSLLRDLIDKSPAGLTIMPGCGITVENLTQVIQATGAREFHATAFEVLESPMTFRNERVYMGIPGLAEYERQVTSDAVVRRFMAEAAGLGKRESSAPQKG